MRSGAKGILIFSYIRRFGPSLGFNFEFKYLFGFQNNEDFRGMKILLILFWGHHKTFVGGGGGWRGSFVSVF